MAVLLVIVILLQKTSTDGLSGIGGGGDGNNMGIVSGKSATSFMIKTTVILAIIFFINALILANLSSKPCDTISSKMKNIERVKPKTDSEKNFLPIAK